MYETGKKLQKGQQLRKFYGTNILRKSVKFD